MNRAISWAEAERIAGRRLDRRRRYGLVSGELCQSCAFTSRCSGCSSEDPYHTGPGMGCHECGHTGKVRHVMWVPIVYSECVVKAA